MLVVLGLVALLAWKPWAAPPPVEPLPSLVAARPTPTASPSTSPIATPTATPPAPTPIATPTSTPVPAAVDITIGSVTDPGSATVECSYSADHDGSSVLAMLDVSPPVVVLSAAAAAEGVRRVAWRVELQVNELETVFSANWQPVLRSPREFAAATTGAPLDFHPRHISYAQTPPGPTSVLRVVVSVDWFGPHQALLGSRSVVATSYAQPGGPAPVLPEGCHAFA